MTLTLNINREIRKVGVFELQCSVFLEMEMSFSQRRHSTKSDRIPGFAIFQVGCSNQDGCNGNKQKHVVTSTNGCTDKMRSRSKVHRCI